MPKLKDLTGQKFGRLTVLGLAPKCINKHTRWFVQCECGEQVIADGQKMKRGEKHSCGCLLPEVMRRIRLKHGRSHTPEHNIWLGMRSRCRPTTTPYCKRLYYDRGIRVCDRWQVFDNFLEDMGPRPSPNHSIDRIDNDGNYCPENCRWATAAEQTRNTRQNHLITFNGETLCLTDWSLKLGIGIPTLRRRIRTGRSVAEILYKGKLQCGSPFDV